MIEDLLRLAHGGEVEKHQCMDCKQWFDEEQGTWPTVGYYGQMRPDRCGEAWPNEFYCYECLAKQEVEE